MTDRPDLSNLPSHRQSGRSVFSARKIALMASVVAGLGVAVYGFSPSTSPADLFSSPAHAQVNNEVRKVERPIGFADIVERVKPSVISVKVNMKEKTASNDSDEEFLAVPAGLADGAILPPLRRTGWLPGSEGRPRPRGPGPGLRLLHLR
ncbi:hypothetical protein ACVWXO_010037 [Bradyrhizobium sp. LM2.7]